MYPLVELAIFSKDIDKNLNGQGFTLGEHIRFKRLQ